jgi:hypothetical protein
VTLPQGDIVDAEDLWGDRHGAGGPTDHPQQGVPTDGEASRLTQSHPGRPTEGQADGEEAGHQPQRAPGPRCGNARQALGEDAAWAYRIGAEEFTDAKLPGDGIATPRQIGERPGVMTMGTPCWNVTARAAGCCLCGRDTEGDPGVRVIEVPGIHAKRHGLR